MNKKLLLVLAIVLLAAAAGFLSASAQPGGTFGGGPPGQAVIDEINGTRGAAMLDYYPEYAQYVIPATGADRNADCFAALSDPLVQEEIVRTRGSAVAKYCGN